jgi:hypothetical protein
MSRNDRSTRVLLGVISILLGANLLVQMNQSAGIRSAVAAGIPDSGAQLQAVVDQVTEVGKKMDKLQSFLESGKMTVVVPDPKASK